MQGAGKPQLPTIRACLRRRDTGPALAAVQNRPTQQGCTPAPTPPLLPTSTKGRAGVSRHETVKALKALQRNEQHILVQVGVSVCGVAGERAQAPTSALAPFYTELIGSC